MSQRAFRERRERHVKNLEYQFHDLLIKHQMLLKSYWMQKSELTQVKRTVDQLTGQLELLRSTTTSSSNNCTTTDSRSRGSRSINNPSNKTIGTSMDSTTTTTATATAAPPSLSPSSSVSSLAFDEMGMGFNSSDNTSDNMPMTIDMSFPLDALPQQQPPQQSQPREQQRQPSNAGIAIPVTDDDDDANTDTCTYMSGLADWSYKLDLGVGLVKDLMTTGSVSGSSNNWNDNYNNDDNGGMCIGWNYLDL